MGPTCAINAPVCVAETTFVFFSMNATNPFHYTQNSYLGSFQTISLQYTQLCKTGPTCAINAPVCVAETTFQFFATKSSIPLIRPKTHVWVCFGAFP